MASYSGSDKRLKYLFEAVTAIVGSIANEYDATSTYAVDSYVIYENVLYKCITAVTTPESFDDTKWSAVLIVNEMGSGGGGGGTTVIANPAGAATDTLNKLQVGSTIYGVSGGGGGGNLSWGTPYVPSVTFKNVNDKYTAQNTGLLNIFVNPSSSSQRIVFKVTNNGVTYSAAWASNGDQNMIVIPINAGDEVQVIASSYISSTILTEIPFNLV